ncbi:MAG TPA: DNA translocase FtsK 4TM domain-containing protein, partial [Roseiarcus sp.]|nr:DNA translocase FtsK 4TM domain-containing protein [Roseiarcus sp.]
MRTTSFSVIDYLPDSVRELPKRRAAELIGASVLAGVGALALALLTWSVEDPSLNHAASTPIHNLLGAPGAIAADIAMQALGLSCVAALTPPSFWAWRLLTHRRLERARIRLTLWLLGSMAAAGLAAMLPAPYRWPLPTGLGGVLGDAMVNAARALGARSTLGMFLFGGSCAAFAILALTAAAGYGLMRAPEAEADERAAPAAPRRAVHEDEEDDADGEPGFGLISLGAAIHAALSLRGALRRAFSRRKPARPPAARAPWLDPNAKPFTAADDPGPALPNGRIEPSLMRRASAPAEAAESEAAASAPSRVAAPAGALKPGRRLQSEAQPSFFDRAAYQLPPLIMLAEPKRLVAAKISEDALEQNARLLEGVLDDFGVKGEIINVRPGPVVTLYELEPAPGIKSSRVIGLADDIARSMSAISARVAVVQGRNAIGIELPNQRRETVYLRELLASQ